MLEQCVISSSIHLSSPPQKPCRCLTGKSLDNHIAISNALSGDHMSPLLRLSDTGTASANLVKWSIITSIWLLTRLRHADFLMVYLHHFIEFRTLDRLEGKLHLPWGLLLEGMLGRHSPTSRKLFSFPASQTCEVSFVVLYLSPDGPSGRVI